MNTASAAPDGSAVVNAGPVQPVLRAVDLTVGYSAIPVIRNLNLEVHSGEIVALLGPNGAGKSTTLAALCGELEPLSGHVDWMGERSSDPPHRRARQGLGFVTEERSIIRGLTTRDNLKLGRGSIDAALALMPELEPMLNRRAGLLSGGQQQMLALACALSQSPRALLVDELSLGLAPLIVGRLLRVLEEAAQSGKGILLVEQHVRQALRVADRAYVLLRGQVALEGTGRELAKRQDEIEALYLSDGDHNV